MRGTWWSGSEHLRTNIFICAIVLSTVADEHLLCVATLCAVSAFKVLVTWGQKTWCLIEQTILETRGWEYHCLLFRSLFLASPGAGFLLAAPRKDVPWLEHGTTLAYALMLLKKIAYSCNKVVRFCFSSITFNSAHIELHVVVTCAWQIIRSSK